MVEAVEIYELYESRGRWDMPFHTYNRGTFKRRYLAERELKRLEAEEKHKETWDDVYFDIKPKLIRPEELKDYFPKDFPEKRHSYIVNLEDVKPIPDTCGKISELYASQNMSMAYVFLSGKAKKHMHSKLEEVYFVISGDGYITIGEEKNEIEEGDTIAIPKNKWHFLETEKGKSLKILVATYPKFTLDDVIVK